MFCGSPSQCWEGSMHFPLIGSLHPPRLSDLEMVPKSWCSSKNLVIAVAVQSLSYIWLFETPWTAARQACLCFTICWSLLTLMAFELMMPSSHVILCHPLFLLPLIFSSIRFFTSGGQSIGTSASASDLPMNMPGLVSFRIDWSDLLAVQGTLKSLIQHHSLKASILQCSAFFMVQLSYPFMTIGKTLALTRRTFVSKAMSLLLNTLRKILKEMGLPDYLTCLLRNLHAGQEATVRTDMEWRTGSKLGKDYVKAVYCHPAYLTHMQSTSHEMPGWMKLKLVSRLPGEISITSDNWWSLLKIQVSGPSPRLV